jgi:hypothetical protein
MYEVSQRHPVCVTAAHSPNCFVRYRGTAVVPMVIWYYRGTVIAQAGTIMYCYYDTQPLSRLFSTVTVAHSFSPNCFVLLLWHTDLVPTVLYCYYGTQP